MMYTQSTDLFELATQASSIRAVTAVTSAKQVRGVTEWAATPEGVAALAHVVDTCTKSASLAQAWVRQGGMSAALERLEECLLGWGWAAEWVGEKEGPHDIARRWLKVPNTLNILRILNTLKILYTSRTPERYNP